MWTDFLFFLEVTRRRITRFLARGGLFRWASGHGKHPEAGPHQPGLLLLQIDGLGRRQFERALAEGKMPFLKSLLERENYTLTPFYSGIPSTTPAVQAEIYYGVCCAVPAFGFLDRGRKDFVLMKDSEAASRVETRLRQQGGEALLKGGSSWMNVYSGGAAREETHFSSVTFSFRAMLRPKALLRGTLMSVLHLPAALRALVLTLGELVLGLWDMARAVLARESFAKELEFIISRVIVSAAIREALVIGGTVDVNRGLPIAHINFLGYDERSHRRGPATRFSHAELHRIDRAVGQLYRAALLSDGRDYQVWVFSDHGHETVRSFEQEFKGGIGQVVQEALAAAHLCSEGKGRILCGAEHRRSSLDRKSLRKELEEQEKPDNEEGSGSGFAVLARGPVAHLYLATPISAEQKRALAAELIQRHVPGVAFLTGPQTAVWVHAGGEVPLPDGASQFFPHPEPIRTEVAKDLVQLCCHPDSGDLVLSGWHPEKQPWTFPLERGAHAGPGLDEIQAFCLLPPNTVVPPEAREFLRPNHLRKTILHALGKEPIEGKPATTVARAGGKLRVVTYNIHSCIGLDGRLSCSRIIRVLRGFDPDIMTLQEVDIHRKRSRGENQAERIAKELQMHYAFCSTVQNEREHYGHALLSRYPIDVVACGRLQAHSADSKREPRGALIARIKLHSRNVWILNTHLGLSRTEREAQVQELLGEHWLGRAGKGDPILLCGDFNLHPGSTTYRHLTSALRDTQDLAGLSRALPTFVSTYPITRIDYIFVNDQVKVEGLRAPRNSLTKVASDHLPLIADVAVETGGELIAEPTASGASERAEFCE